MKAFRKLPRVRRLLDLAVPSSKRAIDKDRSIAFHGRARPDRLLPKLIVIGEWRSKSRPDLPDPVDLVDTDWNVEERQVVVDYLEAGMETPWIMVGSTDCQFCEVSLTNRQLTDQVYVWPTGLAHYLRDHGVRLPPEFVANVRAYYDQPPNMDSTWWEATRSP